MSDYISSITLPSGSTYLIKDSEAREQIAALSGALQWVGTTTTALTDGASTNPITVGGESYTATAGDVVVYGTSEFVWSAAESKWREFGSTGSLGALAFKDDASATYTPVGTVSQPTFTANEASLSVSGTPTGSVSVTPSVVLSETTVVPFASAGTLPSATMPTMTTSVTGEVLSIAWTDGTFNAGTLPSGGDAVTVANGVTSATATASFTGDALTSTGSVTVTGTVSQPTFTGTEATITVE